MRRIVIGEHLRTHRFSGQIADIWDNIVGGREACEQVITSIGNTYSYVVVKNLTSIQACSAMANVHLKICFPL